MAGQRVDNQILTSTCGVHASMHVFTSDHKRSVNMSHRAASVNMDPTVASQGDLQAAMILVSGSRNTDHQQLLACIQVASTDNGAHLIIMTTIAWPKLSY